MKKFYKKIIMCFMIVVMSVLFCACNNTNNNENKNDNVAKNYSNSNEKMQDFHIVIDHAGNEVKVPNKIDRIVITDIYPIPSVISIFFNGASKIVGMAPPSMIAAKNSVLSKLYPEILNAKTDFIKGTSINMEELLKLNPDIIFYPETSKQEGEDFKKLGIPAIAISSNKWDYNAIETLNQWIKLLDEIFELDNNKTKICKEYSEEILNLITERVKDIKDEEKRKVMFLFQYNDKNIMTSGKRFFGNWWAEAIGCKNVGEKLDKDNSVSVNMEQIYEWNPDLIFITNFNEYYPDDLYNNTVGNYKWENVEAIKMKEVFKMPLGMYRTYTAGIDTPITLLWLAKKAYKNKFEDIDLLEKTKEYYKVVFNVNLSNEEVNQIFNPIKGAGVGFANGK